MVVRFEFSGVPASSTKFRMMWLVLERSGVDVCLKDPGFAVDLIFQSNVRDLVAVCLGHVEWRDVADTSLRIEGDRRLAKRLPGWLRLDKMVGRDFPMISPVAERVARHLKVNRISATS